MRARRDAQRYRLFEAVSAVVEHVARRPAVLVLDDLHWADRPTVLMLRQAVLCRTEGAALLVVTYRDTERGDALLDTLADLRREHYLERIALESLDERDASTLLRQLARQDPRVPAGGAVLEETMGNPFFLEEMVRSLQADPAPAASRGGDPAEGSPVPDGIRDVLGRRLARLSERTRRVLSACAVIGREFGVEVLEQVVALPEDELDESLEEAVAAQVLLEVPGEYGRFAFSHALIRQTVYDDLGGTRRARLHGRVGEVLEPAAGDEPTMLSTLAHHFFGRRRASAPRGRSTTPSARRTTRTASSPTRRPRACTSSPSTASSAPRGPARVAGGCCRPSARRTSRRATPRRPAPPSCRRMRRRGSAATSRRSRARRSATARPRTCRAAWSTRRR